MLQTNISYLKKSRIQFIYWVSSFAKSAALRTQTLKLIISSFRLAFPFCFGLWTNAGSWKADRAGSTFNITEECWLCLWDNKALVNKDKNHKVCLTFKYMPQRKRLLKPQQLDELRLCFQGRLSA